MFELQKHKNYLLKEEGNSTNLNQVYDDLVERKDKLEDRQSLELLRKSRSKNCSVMDKCGLIHIVQEAF